ncbi:enoyl-CoA hydratase/isomerase family protein [Streptomyces sp. NPDC054775]
MSFATEYKPTQFVLTETSPSLWRVSFDNPPVNVIGPGLMKELKELLTELETNKTVKVVVFDSMNPEYFLAHYDLAADPAIAEALPSPTGYAAWVDILVRLSKLSQVTISAIRGIARGAGSEFVLATDMRFASLEKTILGQMEVGFTAVAGGGATARLSKLIGRGRAFEVMLGGEDFNGELAERYGYVNRAVPDASFESFVDSFATRVSRWDRQVLSDIKGFVNELTLPDDDIFIRQSDAFWASASRPEFQSINQQLFNRGLQTNSHIERNLGAEMGRTFPELPSES